jgi:O-antigen biosynthesis protein
VFVELGTHRGNSYCGFCQAISRLNLNCSAYAVDTWEGDIHMKVGPEVLRELKEFHDPRFAIFSTLLAMNFNDARKHFQGRTIDLLHIDGTHTYESVRNDFETWASALSDRAIVLFHDTNEIRSDYEVWRVWKELAARFPHFEFLHSHGLGVLGVGSNLPVPLRALFSMADKPAEMASVRKIFSERGRMLYDRL